MGGRWPWCDRTMKGLLPRTTTTRKQKSVGAAECGGLESCRCSTHDPSRIVDVS